MGDGSAQNVLEMINLFNQTAKWVQILILTQPNLSKRAKVMKLCISIAHHMKTFRNFSGSCAFHSALTSTPIHRLKIAWSKLSSADTKKYKELQKIFGYSGDNWQLLRKFHRQAHAPAILHTGLFLADLVGIDEGQQNHLKNGKRRLIRLPCINKKNINSKMISFCRLSSAKISKHNEMLILISYSKYLLLSRNRIRSENN